MKSHCQSRLEHNNNLGSVHHPACSTLKNRNILKDVLFRPGPFTAALALNLALSTPSFAEINGFVETATNSSLMTTMEQVDQLPPFPTKFPPLPPLKEPDYHRFTLKNGLRVILLEDYEAPTVQGILLMRGGQRASPNDKIGIASISAATQRAGGSIQHPEDLFDEQLEDLAAAIEGGASQEALSLGFSCLQEDTPQVMKLFSEVLISPLLPENKIDLFKFQAINSLAHKDDNPSSIPGREVSKLVYGKNSVFSREPTLQTLSSITQNDISAFIKEWERPDTSVLGVVGALPYKEMQKLVETNFENWDLSNNQRPPPSPIPTSSLPDQTPIQGKIYFIDRPGSTQTSLALAEPGIRMVDRDDVGLDVLSDLLNGFGGILFDTIRSREGLAYSVSGGWTSAPLDHEGLFLASAETSKPAQLLLALRQALDAAAKTTPSNEDVNEAKEQSLNSFVFGFSSSRAQLRRAVSFELLGIDPDYPFVYKDRLSKVTALDVHGAAQRHLHPDDEVVVVVGDAKTIIPQIENALGVKVEMLNEINY